MEFRIGNEGTPRRASPSFYDGSHRLLSTSGRPFFRSFFTVLSNPLKPLQELDHTPTVLPGAILVRHPSRFPFPLSPLSSNRFGGSSRPPPGECRLVARTRRRPCIKPFFFAQRPLFQTRNMLPQRGNGPGRTASKRHKRQARNTAFRLRSGSPQSSKSPPDRPLGPDRGMKEAGINSPKLPKIVVFSKDLCLPPKEFRSRVQPSARHRRNVSKANRTQSNPSAFRSCRRGRIRLARSSSSSYPLPARSSSADARPEGSLCIS